MSDVQKYIIKKLNSMHRHYDQEKFCTHGCHIKSNLGKLNHTMGAFKKYVRPEGGGGEGGQPKANKSEQKRTGEGGGLSVWPILFTLAGFL